MKSGIDVIANSDWSTPDELYLHDIHYTKMVLFRFSILSAPYLILPLFANIDN